MSGSVTGQGLAARTGALPTATAASDPSRREVLPRNHLICGDSNQVLRILPKASVDLVVTDPPYICRYRDRLGREVHNDDNADAVMPVFSELYRVMKNDSYCISFYGWGAIAEFAEAWRKAGFRVVGHIVWQKPYVTKTAFAQYCHESAFVLAKGRPKLPSHPIKDVQPWDYSGNALHPTQKAVSVIEPLIQSFSKPGDLVLDPFLGSGTTAVAAEGNGRDYLGIEIDPGHFRSAATRLGKCPTAKTPVSKFQRKSHSLDVLDHAVF